MNSPGETAKNMNPATVIKLESSMKNLHKAFGWGRVRDQHDLARAWLHPQP